MKTIKVSIGAFSVKEMVKFSTSENLKTNKIYLDNWRPDQKDSNWSKSVNFIELEPKCRLETFFDENFEKPMGIWRGGYDKKSVHQAWILFFQSLNLCAGIHGPISWSIRSVWYGPTGAFINIFIYCWNRFHLVLGLFLAWGLFKDPMEKFWKRKAKDKIQSIKCKCDTDISCEKFYNHGQKVSLGEALYISSEWTQLGFKTFDSKDHFWSPAKI